MITDGKLRNLERIRGEQLLHGPGLRRSEPQDGKSNNVDGFEAISKLASAGQFQKRKRVRISCDSAVVWEPVWQIGKRFPISNPSALMDLNLVKFPSAWEFENAQHTQEVHAAQHEPVLKSASACGFECVQLGHAIKANRTALSDLNQE